MTLWFFLSLLGLLLSVAGLVIALIGIATLSRKMFNRPLPRKALPSWLPRMLHRKKTVPGSAQIAGAGTLTATGQVDNVLVLGRPNDGAPLEQWIPYFESRIALLTNETSRIAEEYRTADREIQNALAAEGHTRERADLDLRDLLRTAVGGDSNGTGLVTAFWGLVLVLVGTVCWWFGGILAP
jgi:hypothetical protein